MSDHFNDPSFRCALGPCPFVDGPVHSRSLLPDFGPVHFKATLNRENCRHAGTLSDPSAHSGGIRNGDMG